MHTEQVDVIRNVFKADTLQELLKEVATWIEGSLSVEPPFTWTDFVVSVSGDGKVNGYLYLPFEGE